MHVLVKLFVEKKESSKEKKNHRMKCNIVGVRHERIDTTYVYIEGTWSFPVSDLQNRCSFEGGIIL